LVTAGYLVGSIPFGLYATRYNQGRRGLLVNPCGINAAPIDLYRRSGPNRGLAGGVFLLELAKGFLPTLTGYLALGTPGAVGGGSAALVGHNFPFFGRLRGSSSVAPLVGVLLVVYPIVVVILGMVWTATLAAWRYAGGEYENLVVWAAVLWSLLVFFAHRENIRRLVSGREARIDAPFGDSGRRRIR
jgi:glycerol-3-phosphate acyltransferase PlsY